MKTQQPTKEAIRDWFARQVAKNEPPPPPEQIRRELGWHLIKTEDLPAILKPQVYF